MNATAETEHSKGIFRLPIFPFSGILFVIGLLWGEIFSAVHQSFIIICILFLSISLIFIKKYRTIIFVVIFFLFGVFRIVNYNENFLAGQNFLSGYINKSEEIYFSGKIVSFPSVKNFGSKGINQKVIKFYCKTDEIEDFKLKAKILVYAPVSLFKELPFVGDKIKFSAVIKYPSRFYFNRKINYRNYLYNRGVSGIAKVLDDIKVTKKSVVLSYVSKLRDKLLANLTYAVEGTVESEIINTMLVGTEPSIENRVLRQFSSLGVIHILVISGLHVASIAFLLVTVFMMFGLNKRVSEALTIPILYIYLLIVGFKIAVLRAVLMITFYFLSDFFGRNKNGVNAGVFAGLTQLFFMPRLIYDIGFLYSFFAVFALFLVYPSFLDLIEGRKRFFAKFFFMSFSIWIIVSPLVSYLNSVFFPAGFLLGMLLVFCVQIIIITGFCSIIFGFFSLYFSEIFNYFNFVFMKYILKLVDYVHSLSFMGFYFHNLNYYWLVCYFLSIIFVLVLIRGKMLKASLLIFLYLCIMLIGLLG